jgi:spermidine synthase
VSSWSRFGSVFATVAYYGSDEHEWAFLFGRPEAVEAPTSLMIERLASSRYRPASIDAAALGRGSVPPFSVRAHS